MLTPRDLVIGLGCFLLLLSVIGYVADRIEARL